MRRRSLYLFLAGALLLGALTPLVIPSREPRYQGRTLTSWLLQAENSSILYLEVDSHVPPAVDAVRQIGPAAIPDLLAWIEHPTPLMEQELDALRHLAPGITNTKSRKKDRAVLAMLGFQILGPAASAAVPELTRLMKDPNATQPTREAAMFALARLGTNGLPSLLEALANTNQPARRLVAYAVGSMQYLGTNASPAVPVLVNLLKDQEEQIATRAATALGDLAIEPSLTIPALTNALRDPRPFVRASAASALAHLGEQARPAIPALTEALSDPKLQVRAAATNALLLISTQR
jgi:hypothetical protein